jgi:hypothetical protein
MLLDLGADQILAIRKNSIPFIYGKIFEVIFTNLESDSFALRVLPRKIYCAPQAGKS